MVQVRKFASISLDAVRSDPSEDRVIEGRPRASVRGLYTSPDGRFSVGEWTCTPGRWRVSYDETEYCRIISGYGTLTDHSGDRVPIIAGEEFVIPAGFAGEWEVIETMSKTWAIYLS